MPCISLSLLGMDTFIGIYLIFYTFDVARLDPRLGRVHGTAQISYKPTVSLC